MSGTLYTPTRTHLAIVPTTLPAEVKAALALDVQTAFISLNALLALVRKKAGKLNEMKPMCGALMDGRMEWN